ncbi:hypothetical protein CCACVL1_06653 [Corchorus capsularis]|uniref:Uncharacterized protein n=1 Tax=Corchorus capsularis TaxID=210143 RepID=A0A1R3JE07_COCAP|nr:hypothetical protein CCACVL1_06653 [Corchorus capsularis]
MERLRIQILPQMSLGWMIKCQNETCPNDIRQLLSSSSTTNLHPFPTSPSSSQAATSSSTTHTSKTAKRQFQAAAHEVPSGPNPESNK